MVAGGIGEKVISQEEEVNEYIFEVFSGILDAGTIFLPRSITISSIKVYTFNTQTPGMRENMPSASEAAWSISTGSHPSWLAPRALMVTMPSCLIQQGSEGNSHRQLFGKVMLYF